MKRVPIGMLVGVLVLWATTAQAQVLYNDTLTASGPANINLAALPDVSSVSVTITGTWTGTFVPKADPDGTGPLPPFTIEAKKVETDGSLTTTTSITGNGTYLVTNPGYMRVVFDWTRTSGSATVTAVRGFGVASAGGGGGGDFTNATFNAAFGTAGTPDTQVLTVQGDPSGTAVPVSGTVNVTIDNNVPLRESHQATLQDAVTANGNGQTATILGWNTVRISANIANPATVALEGQVRSGVWEPLSFVRVDGTVPIGAAVQSFTTTGDTEWLVDVSGVQHIRAPVSGCSSCTVTVAIIAVFGGQSPFTSVYNVYPDGTNRMPSLDAAARRGYVTHTDGTNAMPTGDAVARRIYIQHTDGTNSTPAMDAAARPGFQTPTANTTGGADTHYLTSAASTNATSVKASAGQVYLISIVNTTATLYYLRLYNLSSSPTCSSATGFVESIPIPASTSGAGIVRPSPVGKAFGAGIAYCLTGGGSSTNNTNAATGVYLTIEYK